MTAIGGSQVVTINTQTNAVTGTIRTGVGPRDLLVVGGRLFVDDYADADLRSFTLGT
ncbi:MAG: hypothetical protein JF887_05365 [Candidatus Dormibacteraeota bacterium]|uniref:Uncharacterized protein n=1 Tax=Candidatus Amunia macphersoniae TaxID=3127014 RepID=A0A934NEK1_9BACT|nr:hypothetical protein [Candidatus Dormibacteraeota bacterium]